MGVARDGSQGNGEVAFAQSGWQFSAGLAEPGGRELVFWGVRADGHPSPPLPNM